MARDSSGNATITAPAGWNTISNYYTSLDDSSHGLFWKRATGSESGTQVVNFSENVDGSGVGYGVISQWGGCALTGDPFERPTFNFVVSGTAMQGKGLTTAGPDRKVVTFSSHTAAAVTGTNTNGWTEDFESSTLTGGDASIGINSIDQTVAGKVLPIKRTLSGAAASICHTLALVPVGGTAGSADSFADVLFQMQPSGANGSTAFTDESHYNLTLTAVGNAQVQSSKVELDGTGDWVTSDASMRFPWLLRTDDNAASIDFTIDVFGATVDNFSTTRALASCWDASGVNQRCWVLYFTATTGTLVFAYSTGGTSGTSAAIFNYAGITAGSTNNIRVVRSISAGEMYLYVNGTKVATATVSAAALFFATGSPLVVGAFDTTAGTPTAFDGREAAIRIKRGALSTGASYSVESLPLATS